MGLDHSPLIVTDGLMIYLDAANRRSYPGTGNTWYDLRGNVNFALENSPPFLANSAGGSIGFTAANSHSALSSTNLSVLTRFSVEVWHYYTGVNVGNAATLVTEVFPGNTSRINYNLGGISGFSDLRIAFYNNSWRTSDPYTLTANAWYHIVGSFDGSNFRLYINSVNQITTANAFTPAANTAGIRLMKRWDSGAYWGGHLSTVKIYNRALSAVEVLQNYHATKKRYGF
jgi:hypothetical protein